MKRREFMSLLAACLALPAVAAAKPARRSATVTLGSVAMDIPVEMIRRMSALTNYLALAADLGVRFRPSPNLGSAVEDLGSYETQIAYLTPVAYIEARSRYGALPLVAPTSNGRPSFSLVIGVRAGSGISSPEQLKGRRFAFGDEKALLQKAAVESLGLKASDFSALAYLKHYDNIAKAVLAGDFDGGILKDSIAEAFRSRGLRVIGSTEPLPSYVFAVHPAMPAETRAALRDALLALKRDTPQRAAILDAFDSACDGFVVVDDRAYDAVRRLIKPFRS
jgi:phosphonate transport system substrate-binding protein